MKINRNNYETFFLLYADNELTTEEKKYVDDFVTQHPDLKEELDMLMQTILPIEPSACFPEKENLFRTTDTESLVNITNYEEWFVRYADDELSNEEKSATEMFVYKHPECQADFELIQRTRLTPDMNIRFTDKKSLYRHEQKETKPVLISMWFRYAVAAAVLVAAGIFWLQNKETEKNPVNPVTIASRESLNDKKITDGTKEEQELKANDVPPTTGHQETKVMEVVAGNGLQAGNEKPKRKPAAGNSYIPEKMVLVDQPRQLVAATDQKQIEPKNLIPPAITDVTVSNGVDISVAANKLPAKTDKVIRIVPDDKPNVVYASNAAQEDYIFVPTQDLVRKTPLRGLLRKAGRYIEQKNPLSSERSRGGVFTASAEQ